MNDIAKALTAPPPATPRTGETLIIASHNPGKVREIGDLLGPLGLSVVSASDKSVPEPEETEPTFEGNAALKALHAAQAAGLPALADDSGLCVDALGGDPGIYSARWGGPEKDFALAMQKVEAALQTAGANMPEARGAHFVCVLAFARPGGACTVFRGEVHGRLIWPPRGTKGFGYDPMFVAEGMNVTFGEMEPDAKHAISHRAKAFEKLLAAWDAAAT